MNDLDRRVSALELEHIRFGPQEKFYEELAAEREKFVQQIIQSVRENKMHYKNGREAKNGDKIMLLATYGSPIVGILYDAQAGNDFCNGKLAPTSPLDPCPNLKECLHLDDVLTLFGNAPEPPKS